MKPTLYIFSGLPGTGKTTISKKFAAFYGMPYFRIDTIEQGLREVCSIKVEGEGYRLAYRIVKDNLAIGSDVVVDCCNPIDLTRKEWHEAAIKENSKYTDIEIVCSDKSIHKNRVQNRKNDIHGLELPTWEQIEKREYHDWKSDKIQIDTSNKNEEESFKELISKLKLQEKNTDRKR